MPKRCVVDGCKSGWSEQRKRFKLLRMKPISLFSVPTSPEQLDKWNEALDGNKKKLSSTDVVCQLHFSNEDIETHFVHIMPDGTKHTIEREKWRLKDSAIPLHPKNDDKYIEKMKKAAVDCDATTETAPPSELTTSTIKLARSMFRSLAGPEQTTAVDPDPLWASLFEDGDLCDVNRNDRYSIESLSRDLSNTNWREGWVWFRRNDPASIKFVQFDMINLKPRIYCSVSASMETTISLGDKSAHCEISGGTITSFDETMTLLDEVERLKECVGTGHKEKMRAPDCPAFLTDEHMYRRNFGYERCLPCRSLRHKLQKRTNGDL